MYVAVNVLRFLNYEINKSSHYIKYDTKALELFSLVPNFGAVRSIDFRLLSTRMMTPGRESKDRIAVLRVLHALPSFPPLLRRAFRRDFDARPAKSRFAINHIALRKFLLLYHIWQLTVACDERGKKKN
ncbi:hypothetical protein PUN28_000195 [Cardiocondyla obscurior]|uniref:Uncharacterized protein n=1 Tax=Cardiocondyla obscurior TaxID=286306 RepID=A0AAW2GY51_9HYME